MSFHKNLTGTDLHVLHAYTYADAATRAAATGFAATDVGKIAKQTDTNTYWILTDDSPVTWKEITAQGGGGGALEWRAGTDNPAPLGDTEFNQQVYKFVAGDGQSLYALVKVPNTYTPGAPITLDLDFYSPSTSNNWQFSTVASLIRKGTDAAGSTSNQRTSTPTATTNGSPSNKLVQVSFDLTDSTGNINGVAVSAGDEIEVQLARSAVDTDTADVRMRPDSTSIRLS